MATFIRLSILISFALLSFAGCSTDEKGGVKAPLGLGTNGGTASTQSLFSGSSTAACAATPLQSTIASGSVLVVQVQLAGVAPFTIPGYVSSTSSSLVSIQGVLSNNGTAPITVVRNVPMTDANGSGHCAFTVTVEPQYYY